MPVRVTVQDGEVSFAETVTCVGRMLDDGRFVIAGVLFGCRIVLLEALAPLATCFAYVRCFCFAGLAVLASAGCEVDDAGFVDLLNLVFGFDQVFP